MQAINIGILGLGTVGSGVLRLLRDHQKKISSITGRQLVVKKVVVHDIEKKRNLDLSGITVTDDVNELINDQDIQIVVEVMGTVKLAKDYIERLLRAGKHIITANKDLIATHGSELAELAGENHCDLSTKRVLQAEFPF